MFQLLINNTVYKSYINVAKFNFTVIVVIAGIYFFMLYVCDPLDNGYCPLCRLQTKVMR